MNNSMGNGMSRGMFGGNTATATAPAPSRKNLSGRVAGLTPEDIVTSPNFTLVEGILTGSVMVTPRMAENWLTRVKNVRQLHEPTLLLYKENMLKGQWDFNGETIKFDKDGNLIDGQHRCAAAVASGKSFMTSVVYGVESAMNIDRGNVRKVDQLIQAEGFAVNPKTMSAMINYLHAYDDEASKGFVTVGHGRHPLTMEDRLAFARDNAMPLNHSISVTDKARKLFNTPSLHAALHFVLAKTAGEALADDFYTKLITGNGLASDDPVYHLRERLLKLKREGGKGKSINPYAGLILKGWNYYITGQRIARFQYNFANDGVAKIKRSPVKTSV